MKYANFDYEQQFWTANKEFIVGIDEVGRGSFAGPLVAAAVIFPKNCKLKYKLADSKLLTFKKRVEMAEKIKSDAKAFAIAEIDIQIINKIGIGEASHKAFRKLLKLLTIKPEHILIDGFFIKRINKLDQTPIIHGDQKSASIAAASIIAKVYRDNLMIKLDLKYPKYNFRYNMGYGTLKHREAINIHGLSSIHRKSFNLQKYINL